MLWYTSSNYMDLYFELRGTLLMEKKKLDRISELYRKSKKSEGLNEDEKLEQQKLRDEYRKGVLNNLTGQLDNMTILEPDGSKIAVKDMKKKG